MIEKPAIEDGKIIACVQTEYGFPITALNFLPLGADVNSAVYRAMTEDGCSFFVKLRRGDFDTISVDVPKFLHDQGIAQIICPIKSLSGVLSAKLSMFNVVLYPFIDGKNGWDLALDVEQWSIFGKALRQIHEAVLPSALRSRIPHENYSSRFRQKLGQFLSHIESRTFAEPTANAFAQLLKDKRSIVNHIVECAENFATILTKQKREHVLCHTDIHKGNLLIHDDKVLYIVDWDQPMLAPKERDLMFIGGGIGGMRYSPEQEESMYYAGYGQTKVDALALAYYRYERIVHDLVDFCEQLLMSDEGGDDRLNSLRHATVQFLPGNVVDIAYQTEKRLLKDIRAEKKGL